MFPDPLLPPIEITEAPEGHDAKILLDFMSHYEKPLIHVARNASRQKEFAAAVKFYSPATRTFEFPAWDCPPYTRISPHPNVVAQRIHTLGNASRINRLNPFIIQTTVNAIIQRLPPTFLFQNSLFSLRLGSQINTSELIQHLGLMGYRQVSSVLDSGDYALRGGIIDVFPPGYSNPYRIDFFGNQVDGIREFSTISQTTIAHHQAIDLLPISEIVLDQDSISRFRQNFRASFGGSPEDKSIYQAVSNGLKVQGIENWLSFFYDQTDLLTDYFPEAFVVFDFEADKAISDRLQLINDLFLQRSESDQGSSDFTTRYYPCPPSKNWVTYENLLKSIPAANYGFVNPYPGSRHPRYIAGGGRYLTPKEHVTTSASTRFATLVKAIAKKNRQANFLVACWTDGSRDRIRQYLLDEELTNLSLVDNLREGPNTGNRIMLTVWQLPWGFRTDSLIVISEQDIFGRQSKSIARKRQTAERFWQEFNGLQKGELIIHEDHGIGRFTGLDVVPIGNLRHDCLTLEYAGGDKLYLPVENMDLITRHGQSEASLDKLGGTAWIERKARIQEDLFKIADDIIQTSATRKIKKAPILRPESKSWDLLAAGFPFLETDDQQTSIADVLTDFASGIPMDRLICGDVGFGKTEIAIRAAFVAAMEGKQVAVLAPTTLLVEQHHEKFLERLSKFPLIIKKLSRMTPKREEEQTLKTLAKGSVDIVIGTHTLLADRIQFADLGLLVIDEEQSFGVVQKEKLKKLKADVHVLTLTATPIPRTLQFALSGLKDISLLTTPPQGRMATSTFVTEFDPILLRQALIREQQRGGQSIVLVPRIMDLDKYEQFLQDNVPEIRYVKAHGRMRPKEMKNETTKFFSNNCDALLATTIISSGIDVPTANTIIVCDAHRFGLAQLYQIRGRVGRSNIRAYAYITYPPRTKLTDQTLNRFRIFASLDSLGAGLALSSHDLEMRGGGNLLGDRQSGHIRLIGFELYHRMLEETVAKLESDQREEQEIQADEAWAPKLNLGFEARIPETYIADLDTRLGVYQRLAALSDKVDLEHIAAELVDRFGPMPNEVRLFIQMLVIKGLCKRAGINRLECSDNGLTLWFNQYECVDPVALTELVHSHYQGGKIFEDRLFLRRTWSGEKQKLQSILTYLNMIQKSQEQAVFYRLPRDESLP